jgi:hypothetical protein
VFKDLLTRVAVGLIVTVVVYALWQLGVWGSSLMTMRTPFYFAVHKWLSLIVSPLLGIVAGVLYDK